MLACAEEVLRVAQRTVLAGPATANAAATAALATAFDATASTTAGNSTTAAGSVLRLVRRPRRIVDDKVRMGRPKPGAVASVPWLPAVLGFSLWAQRHLPASTPADT